MPLEPEAAVVHSVFYQWVKRTLSRPFLSAGELRVISPKQGLATVRPGLVRLKGLEIGGGEYATKALDTVKCEDLSPEELLEWHLTLHDAALHNGPVLYVGESDDIGQRIREHLGGSSGLLERFETLGLTVAEVGFSYLPLQGWSSSNRKSLEKLLTHILITPLTLRPG